jgi:5-methyltetrahydropteroyltriglutamate--homocysteine methyltransferase
MIKMLTTVVGSYPSFPKDPKSLTSRLSNFFGSYDQYLPALELAVKDQVNAGVDVISDGQVRGDMIEVFARNIPGMGVEEGTPKILGKIRPANHSLGANDLNLALKTAGTYSKEFIDSYNDNSKLIVGNDFNNNFKGVKGIITGPTTLVLSCRVEGFYNRDKKEKIIGDMALALKKEAQDLQNAGACMIQIDEPFLSTGVADTDTAKKAVRTITDNIKIPVSMHVCGDVGHVLSEILKFPVQIIDCEFAGIPSNMDALKQEYQGSKKIGFGCIDTRKMDIEPIDHVVGLIKRGIDIIGKDNMIIDPDCGMRMLSRDAAQLKLKRMKEAVEWL